MPTPRYPRGSEWRKWDLHFHTPASYDYQFKAATSEQIVKTMIDANVGAFAVTDHHVIDVARIKAMQACAAGRVTISRQATRVARMVEIRKLATATTTEKSFACALPLNDELVASRIGWSEPTKRGV